MRATQEIAIVGGGLIGLATARAVLELSPGATVTILEKEDQVARHQSGRNSGVIHAGVYYAPGSLKAELCREGRAALLEFAEEHDVEHRITGKLVVAVDDSELPRLESLRERSLANGVRDVRELGRAELREIEPHVAGVRALHVPESGIIDYAAVARRLAATLKAAGVRIERGSEVTSLERRRGRTLLGLRSGDTIDVGQAIICGGLQSDRLAALATGADDPEHRIVPFRGDYLKLSDRAAALVRGLVYPVPDPALPFLGVHFTPRLDGQVWAGPNAVPALARERYRKLAFDRRDALDTIRFPGTWRLVRTYLRAGTAEIYRDVVKRAAVADLRRYLPALRREDVTAGPCGVRAQVLRRDGTLVDDFLIRRSEGVLSVVNAPSPGATASFAIGRRLARMAVETT